MALHRKKLPEFEGDGLLRYPGEEVGVRYLVEGDPSALKPGTARLRGSFEATPQVAEAAFRAGTASLTLEDGASRRITLLGHTEGSAVTYFEMRV